MFEQFTHEARQVVVFAQDEARTLKHNYIGTEHVLLGLLREDDRLPAQVLTSLGVGVESARSQVAQIIGHGDDLRTGQIPFTPRAKRVLELALKEALALGHGHIEPEHLLLGLVRENEGVASRILDGFGADAQTVRAAVFERIGIEPPLEYEQTMARAGRTHYAVDSGAYPFREYTVLRGALFLLAGTALGILIGWLIWG